jgi:hypothetical protein
MAENNKPNLVSPKTSRRLLRAADVTEGLPRPRRSSARFEGLVRRGGGTARLPAGQYQGMFLGAPTDGEAAYVFPFAVEAIPA